jgi:arabinofuranan 3-O-arabinosyltransferase
VTRAADDSVEVRVTGARPGEPIWLSFGQSQNAGWAASIDGHDLGAPALVDGFANGWLVDPPASDFDVQLTFEPQQRVQVALWLSAAAAVLCLALAARRPRRSPIDAALPVPMSVGSVEGPPAPRLDWPWTIGVALALGVVGALVVSPTVAVLTGVLAVVEARGLLPRALTAAVPALAMALAGAYVTLAVVRHDIRQGLEWPSELTRAHPVAWFAVLALVGDVVVHGIRRRRRA